MRVGTTVRTGGYHSIKGIGHSQDASVPGNGLAFQSVGIAAAIPALMVVQNAICTGNQARHISHDIRSKAGMRFYDFPILRCELSLFVEYTVGNGNLADIVKQSGGAYPGYFIGWQADGFSQSHSVAVHFP